MRSRITAIALGMVLSVALIGVQPVTAAPAGATLDLRVLLVSSGGQTVDLGLGLMMPLLEEMGVPYDVLDARAENLTADRLAAGDAGRYNGIILTEAALYDPSSPTGSAFTAEEWEILHTYERTFDVRESVMSGFPGTYPQFGLDYGMSDVVAGAPFVGRWIPPAGTEVFEYVNTARPFPISDYAINARPLRLYAGEPSEAAAAPQVQPLLVLDDDPAKAFVSVLRYDDGREVLLSTITNASYLIHSQVLAYEFVNFATRGLFIGGRFAQLAAHVDDLFIGDSLWDPVSNRTIDDNVARLSAADFRNAVASQDAFRAHPTAADFVLDFAFNGIGAQTSDVPSMVLASVADTFLKQKDPTKNFGTDPFVEIRNKAGDSGRGVLRFAVPVDANAPFTTASLTLYSDGARVPAAVCRATTAWNEGLKQLNRDASWVNARTGVPWSTPGGDYDAASCVNFTLPLGNFVTVDVTSIVSSWVEGSQPNHGFIVVATGAGNGRFRTREEPIAVRRPSLRLDFGRAVTAEGPFTAPGVTLPSTSDTYIGQAEPSRNFGTEALATTALTALGTYEKRPLLGFGVLPGRLPPVASATLELYTEGALIDAQVCPVIDTRWEEGSSSWGSARTGVNWRSGPGGDFDPAECQDFRFANGARVQVDITGIVQSWQLGEVPNFGLVVVGRSVGQGTFRTREAVDVTRRPTLRLSFETVVPDGLTAAVLADADRFRFLNHTLSHRDMDVSAGATYDQARYEIEQNRAAWDVLGLPARAENNSVLVAGDHSGLGDDRGTDTDPTDDLDYPDARNPEFVRAASDAGVGFLASDSSRPNQNTPSYVPGFEGSLLLVPRWPTAVFYNVTSPEPLVDEYNYLFYERFVLAGQDPCTIPGAICTPRTYEQIVAAESEIGLRHILTYGSVPHFFHESNLTAYDGSGSTLLFDWLEATVSRYEALLSLPLRNPPYYELAQDVADGVRARASNIRGVLDLDTGQVTVWADASARTLVTGVAGGELYGGQRIARLDVGPAPRTLSVDSAP